MSIIQFFNSSLFLAFYSALADITRIVILILSIILFVLSIASAFGLKNSRSLIVMLYAILAFVFELLLPIVIINFILGIILIILVIAFIISILFNK